MGRDLLRKTATLACTEVQLPAAVKAPHCAAVYNRGLSISVQGLGIRLSQLCLIPSLLLLHKKTKPDPPSPNEKEMVLTLAAEAQSRFFLTGEVTTALFFHFHFAKGRLL